MTKQEVIKALEEKIKENELKADEYFDLADEAERKCNHNRCDTYNKWGNTRLKIARAYKESLSLVKKMQ